MLRRFYRAFRCVALAASLIVVSLLLRPSAPPPAQTDPRATERLQARVEQMERDVAEGRLRLQPTSGMLGSMPIPKVTLDRAVSRIFDSAENRDKFLLPEAIKDIRVVDGELIVSYR